MNILPCVEQQWIKKNIICAQDLWKVNPDPGDVVPQILHRVFYYPKKDIKFYHAVCVMSGLWIIQPKYLVLWIVEEPPEGLYWNYLLANLSSQADRVVFMHITRPKLIYNYPSNDVFPFENDLMRIEILYWFGGIYLDTDTVVLKSFKPLYKYIFTVGRERPTGLASGNMLSSRGNLLLLRWHQLFRFHARVPIIWGDMAVTLLNTLYELVPEYFHIEEESMVHPNCDTEELRWIYEKERVWNWQEKNYCVHLYGMSVYKRSGNVDFNSIKTEDSMFGDMLRFILYGNSSMIY